MLTIDTITDNALILPPDQRLTLAFRLISSVEVEPEPGAQEAWDAEIVERIRNYDLGKTKTIPAADVFKRVERELKK